MKNEHAVSDVINQWDREKKMGQEEKRWNNLGRDNKVERKGQRWEMGFFEGNKLVIKGYLNSERVEEKWEREKAENFL